MSNISSVGKNFTHICLHKIFFRLYGVAVSPNNVPKYESPLPLLLSFLVGAHLTIAE